MTVRRRQIDTLFAALLLALLGAAWVAFAPTRFGGQAAYVIVSGISMEPSFHRGDLAILRHELEYAIGDVVTYRHPTIGPVIHRIIGRDGDRFVFKGDNNSWIDEYHPAQDELIGKLWIHLPATGKVVEQLRIPRNMAAMVAVIGVMVMAAGTGSVGRRPRRRPALLNVRLVVGGPAPARQKRAAAVVAPIASRDDLLFVLATVACAALLLAGFAFTRPLARSTLEDISYTHTGAWSYSADAPPDLYDGGAVGTGAPIFRRLASEVALHFSYRLTADQPPELQGSYRLVAEIVDVSGWKRTVELKPATAFSGGSFTADATLDLARVQVLIDTFEQYTGEQRPQYMLAIMPELHVQGQLAGQPLSDDFTPRLEFQLDRQALRLQKDSGGSLNPLQPVKQGLVKRERTRANTLALLGLELEVGRARQIALVVLALAFSCGALLMLRGRGATRNDEVARIQRKYGPLLIAVRESDATLGAIEVATIDDLARLAERGGHMILQQIEQGAPCYFIRDAGATYCYRAEQGAAAEERRPC
jgi:signal peptidase I